MNGSAGRVASSNKRVKSGQRGEFKSFTNRVSKHVECTNNKIQCSTVVFSGLHSKEYSMVIGSDGLHSIYNA